MASSSSATIRWKYDVFLSFRGEDTRNTFASYLYHALSGKGINVFIDDNLERGLEISPALLEVIDGSRISIVILSQNYASSTYCLDELEKILKCKDSNGQLVFPIFYKVDPSDVEEQTGSFGEALTKHEAQFMGKVHMWRLALSKVAKLSGWPLENGGDEAKFIQIIIENVMTKLNRTFLHASDFPVGLDSHLQDMSCMLSLESNDVHMVGVYGTGGIGKTTIAKAIYNKIANQFEGSCFLADVGEISEEKYGLVKLQKTLLFEILGDKMRLMGNCDKGINVIRERLCSKKVLIVIDDANNVDQLKKLAGQPGWFGAGSRIIITTRDERVLVAHGVERVHKVKELCHDDALELFSWNAFRKTVPQENYIELSLCVLKYCKGLPLALVVLGSFLYGRSEPEWESELGKLKQNPKKEIDEILKISYNGLDNNEKAIFLDVACFFKGMNKDYVMKILDACDFNPVIGLQILIEKSLISIENKKLQMHDLIQSMGRHVVYRESSKPGERSRLWFHEDVLPVLTEDMGTDDIEAIYLELPKSEEIHVSAEAFVKMRRLRMLKIHNAQFTGGPINLPNELRWLEWPGCPITSMPSGFHAKKLLVINMQRCCIRKFGEGFKNYNYLKCMDFRDCELLTETPDFSTIPNLEILNLEGCTNLVEVHQSVGCLDKLCFLGLEFCSNLKRLPSSFKLRSLHTLLLTACKKLEVFPDIVERMACLEKVCLNGTAIKKLPSSIENLIGLKVLTLTYCKNLTNLPTNIYKLRNLKRLLLEGCSRLDQFPVNVWNEVQSGLSAFLNAFESASGSSYKPLPLPTPIADSCNSLDSYSLGFPNLRYLDLRNCNVPEVNFLMVPNLFSMLKDLDLSGNNFVSLPASIRLISNLRSLKVSNCKKLREIPELPRYIKRLEAKGCESLERFTIVERSNRLHDIDFSNCHKLAKHQGQLLENALLSKGFIKGSRIEMFLPGSEMPEMPEGFSYYSEDGSLSFKISSQMCEKIMALTLCAILSLEDQVEANISREVFVDGENVVSFSRQFFSLESDHVWLYRLPCHFTRDVCSQKNDFVQFEVSFKVLGSAVGSTLKRCGVYVVCKQDWIKVPVDQSASGSRSHHMDSISVDLVRSCDDNELKLNLHHKSKRKTTEESLMANNHTGKRTSAELLMAYNHAEHPHDPLMASDSGGHQWKQWLSLSLQPMDQINWDPMCIEKLEDKAHLLSGNQ